MRVNEIKTEETVSVKRLRKIYRYTNTK